MKRNLFIIVILLVLLAFGLYKLINRPYMTLKIKYNDVPPVITGFPRGKIDAYYRGYYVGKVSKIELSNDQKFIIFYLEIYFKKLKLPKNIKIFLNSEDLYGARHFSLYYPENPSSKLLADGDTVYGTGIYERLDKYLVRELSHGKLKNLIDNALFLTGYLRDSLKGLKPDIAQAEVKRLVKELPYTLNRTVEGLQNVNIKIPVVNSNINRASGNISQASNRISNASNNIAHANRSILSVNKNISLVNQIIPQVNTTIDTTNSHISTTNCNLAEVNRKIPEIPQGLLENANQLVNKANCLTDEITDILSKRFLLFRLMFGSPASSLKRCTQDKNDCVEHPAQDSGS